MGKLAARVGDLHECPKVNPGTGTPHVGGEIKGEGCGSVLINGKPAATVGDVWICGGEPNVIEEGSSGVFIGGKPAARKGDSTSHRGVIVGGSENVFIGEKWLNKPELLLRNGKSRRRRKRIRLLRLLFRSVYYCWKGICIY